MIVLEGAISAIEICYLRVQSVPSYKISSSYQKIASSDTCLFEQFKNRINGDTFKRNSATACYEFAQTFPALAAKRGNPTSHLRNWTANV